MTEVVAKPMRRVVAGTLVACLVVAMAPWLTGGREPVAAVVTGAALLLGALLVWRQSAVRRSGGGSLGWAWLGLMAWGGLSLVWTANRFSTAVWLMSWLMAGVAFWLAGVVAGDPRGRRWLIAGYVGSAAVFCLVAIGMYVASSYDRLTGTFYWANPAAAYLIPALVLSWEGVRTGLGRRKWAWAALSGLFLCSFLLTDSRGALAVVIVLAIFFGFLNKISRRSWVYYLFVVIVGIGLSIGLAQVSGRIVQHSAKVVPGSRLAEVVKGESVSGGDRLRYLASGFEIWFDHPVLGTGAGTYGDVHPRYQQRVVSASDNAHNVYVQVLAELGLVGAGLLAWVVVWLLAGVVRAVVHDSRQLPFVLAMGGLLVHFGLDIDASYPALLILAGVILGMTYRRRVEGWGPAPARWPAVALVAMAMAAVLYQSRVWGDRARAAQEDGDLAVAIDDYGRAQLGGIFDPDYVGAEGIAQYAVAASGGLQAGKAAEAALERARTAEKLDPRDGQHHQLEGRVLVLRGDLKGAAKAFGAALALDPYNHPDYALDLASVESAMGNKVQAMATAKAMLAQYPPLVVVNRSGDAALRPNLANLEALVGNGELADGDVERARMAARRALELDPTSLRGRALNHAVEQRLRP